MQRKRFLVYLFHYSSEGVFYLIIIRFVPSPPILIALIVAIGFAIYCVFSEREYSVPWALTVGAIYLILGIIIPSSFNFIAIIGFSVVGLIAGALGGGLYGGLDCDIGGGDIFDVWLCLIPLALVLIVSALGLFFVGSLVS